MSFMQAARNALDVLRMHGPPGVYRVARAHLAPGSRTIFLFTLSNPLPLPRALAAASDHDFHFASTDEVIAIRDDHATMLSERDIEASRAGDRCLLQMDGERLVGYTWIAKSHLVFLAEGYHINLPDDTVYNYKGFTSEDYRGHGFQALRHSKLLDTVKQDGITRLFGYVDCLNFDSLRGVSKSGYKRVGSATFHRGSHIRSMTLNMQADIWCDLRRI